MYVVANPFINASTIGMNKPIIVLNSALVDLLDEEELRFLIAHELGHALSGHAVYHSLLRRLIVAQRGAGVDPPRWHRPARDRGRADGVAAQVGALRRPGGAAGHPGPAGGLPLPHEDRERRSPRRPGLDLLLRPGHRVRRVGDLRESVLRLLLVENQSHPFAVVRARELRRWVDSGAYTALLAGAYPRRDEDADAGLSEAAREAAQSYSESFRNSQDALGKFVHDTAGLAGSVKGWFDETFGRGAVHMARARPTSTASWRTGSAGLAVRASGSTPVDVGLHGRLARQLGGAGVGEAARHQRRAPRAPAREPSQTPSEAPAGRRRDEALDEPLSPPGRAAPRRPPPAHRLAPAAPAARP